MVPSSDTPTVLIISDSSPRMVRGPEHIPPGNLGPQDLASLGTHRTNVGLRDLMMSTPPIPNTRVRTHTRSQ